MWIKSTNIITLSETFWSAILMSWTSWTLFLLWSHRGLTSVGEAESGLGWRGNDSNGGSGCNWDPIPGPGSSPLIWPSLTSGMRLTGFMWDLNRQEMALSRHGFSSFNVWYILAFLCRIIKIRLSDKWMRSKNTRHFSHWSCLKLFALWV